MRTVIGGENVGGEITEGIGEKFGSVFHILADLRNPGIFKKVSAGIKQICGRVAAESPAQLQMIHTLIRKKLLWVGVLAGVTALSTVLWWGVIPSLPELELTVSGGSAQDQNTLDTIITTTYQILTDGYRFVDLAIGGVWIGLIGSAIGEISDQMEYTSMMR